MTKRKRLLTMVTAIAIGLGLLGAFGVPKLEKKAVACANQTCSSPESCGFYAPGKMCFSPSGGCQSADCQF